jgi:excisionase family DNA binding protein
VQLSLFQRATNNASWVARRLNTSTQTVCRLIEEGKLQAYKLRDRGPWHIFMDSVAEFERQIKDRHGLQTRADGQK